MTSINHNNNNKKKLSWPKCIRVNAKEFHLNVMCFPRSNMEFSVAAQRKSFVSHRILCLALLSFFLIFVYQIGRIEFVPNDLMLCY